MEERCQSTPLDSDAFSSGVHTARARVSNKVGRRVFSVELRLCEGQRRARFQLPLAPRSLFQPYARALPHIEPFLCPPA